MALLILTSSLIVGSGLGLPGASFDASGIGPRWIAILAQTLILFFHLFFCYVIVLLMVEILSYQVFDKNQKMSDNESNQDVPNGVPPQGMHIRMDRYTVTNTRYPPTPGMPQPAPPGTGYIPPSYQGQQIPSAAPFSTSPLLLLPFLPLPSNFILSIELK